MGVFFFLLSVTMTTLDQGSSKVFQAKDLKADIDIEQFMLYSMYGIKVFSPGPGARYKTAPPCYRPPASVTVL